MRYTTRAEDLIEPVPVTLESGKVVGGVGRAAIDDCVRGGKPNAKDHAVSTLLSATCDVRRMVPKEPKIDMPLGRGGWHGEKDSDRRCRTFPIPAGTKKWSAGPRVEGIDLDLGISGGTALLCASNAGPGFACARTVAAEGVNEVINGRDPAKTAAAVTDVEEVAMGNTSPVLADVATDHGREALLEACPHPDILLNYGAGPKPKRVQETTRGRLGGHLPSNHLAPILLVHAVLPNMIGRRFRRTVNITSAMVTAPRPQRTPSAGAWAGLTASLKALSLDVAQYNVTINNMLPERVDSPRSMKLRGLRLNERDCPMKTREPRG